MTKNDPTRRGGRKPGEWKLLKENDLRDWREKANLSRARLAAMLHVSSTSIQNWETGNAVPSLKFQQRLADLMSQPLAALPMPARPCSLFDPPAADGSGVAEATAQIVTAYMAGKENMDQEQLVALIRSVKAALS